MKTIVKFFNREGVIDPFAHETYEDYIPTDVMADHKLYKHSVDEHDNLVITEVTANVHMSKSEVISVFASGRWAEVHVE